MRAVPVIGRELVRTSQTDFFGGHVELELCRRQRLYTLPPTNKYSQPLKRSSSEFRNVWALCITVSAQIWQIVGLVEEGLRVLLELVLIEAIHLLALEHELVIIVVIVRIL